MLILIPLAAFILTLIGWDSLYVPESLIRFLQVSLLVAALGCAYPLRKVLKRAQPLGWGAKIVVFSLVLALWFFSLVPVLMIANVKLDSHPVLRLERTIEAAEERGPQVCKVKVSDWNGEGGDSPHWLWMECSDASQLSNGKTKIGYSLHRGGIGFAWVSEVRALPESGAK